SAVGSPLCNLRVGSDDGGADLLCDPDDVEDGGSLQCPSSFMDAAVVVPHATDGGGAADEDGGSASDAGTSAPPVDATSSAPAACRVAAPNASALQLCSPAGAGK